MESARDLVGVMWEPDIGPGGDGGLGGDSVVDSILRASRAMVSLAETSVHQITHDVTLTQFRTLVALADQGPCHLSDLARAMGISPSTATRMCDRLVRKHLIDRVRDEVDRREIVLSLTDTGRSLVSAVTARRHAMIDSVLHVIPPAQRAGLVRSLDLVSDMLGTGHAPISHPRMATELI